MGEQLNIGSTASVSATGNPSNKVALKKGRGLMDWVRLGNTEDDLAGTGGKLIKVTTEELAKHNNRKDAWMALRGKVYNVTPYFEYHPGGEDELTRGIGKDATDLFNDVHKWVNFESMLKKCFVGQYVETRSLFPKPKFLAKKREESLALPPPKNLGSSTLLSSVKLPAPKFDWFQAKTLINIAIHSKWKELTNLHVIVVNNCQHFKIYVYIQDQIFIVNLELLHPIESEFDLKVYKGKLDILMKKALPNIHWSSIGKKLQDNNKLIPIRDINIEYFTFKIIEKAEVTHDSYLFTLEPPPNMHFAVPFGFHIYLRVPQSDISKPYTPLLFPFVVPMEENFDKNLKLLIKIYPDGELTSQLKNLSVGDSVEVSLPQGSFSMANLRLATQESAYLALIGAGSGITPLIKVLMKALKNSIPTRLILFNKKEIDIPWRSEFDNLMQSHSNVLKVTHVLSSPSEEWNGTKGIVRKELLDDLLPISDGEKETYVCVCGSNKFTDLTLKLLKELCYSDQQIHAFKG